MDGNGRGVPSTWPRRSFGRLGRRLAACGVVAALLTLAVPTSAVAAPAYLLISTTAVPGGALMPFDTDNPTAANLNARVTITGTGGERVLAIDSRPPNGVLYGISEASRLYAINPATGSATQVGAPGATQLDPFTGVFQGVGFDFDPVADLLRVTEDDGLVNGQDDNFSVNPNTGVFTQQSDLGGAATDVDIAGVAYTNNAAGASQTTLYGIETNQPVGGNSRLVVINPPAAGTLTTTDSNANGLGVAVDSQEMGFDIGDANRAFAALSSGGVFAMYRVNLAVADGGNGTGDATLIGVLGSAAAQSAIPGFRARGFALALPAPPATTTPAPAFGSLTNVALALSGRRIPARGPLKVRVANSNSFPISGVLSARTTKPVARRRVDLTATNFNAAAGATQTVTLRLPRVLGRQLARRGRLSLRLTAKVTDPAGNTRTVSRAVTPKLKKARRRR